jgi:hypothetical protein
MRRLYHAFPRPRGNYLDSKRGHELGFRILELILTHGLLCTPERFTIEPDPSTQNLEKRRRLMNGEPEEEITQSRACFTLLHLEELSQRITASSDVTPSHQELFGDFAIGFDAIEAREIGILPVVYFYKSEHDIPFSISKHKKISGLGSEIVHRLLEIRTLLSILANIEAIADPIDLELPSRQKLKEIGITLNYESEIEKKIDGLTRNEACRIFDLFNSDRVVTWSIHDFVTMLLSFYQTVDSTAASEPLAFFNQREWRLIHHFRPGLLWFNLSMTPKILNPVEEIFLQSKLSIREFLKELWQVEQLREDRIEKFWVLAGVGDYNFRDFVREVVVPRDYVDRALRLVSDLDFNGMPPRVESAPETWSLDVAERQITS